MKLLPVVSALAYMGLGLGGGPSFADAPPAPGLAYSAVRIIGFCMADRSSPAARRVVDQDYAAPAYRAALAALVQPVDSCMPLGHIVYNPVQLGGGIAEYFLASHISRGSLESELAHGPIDRELASKDATQRLGACIIRKAPAKVVALLKAVPDSPDEPRAWREITPDASACVTEAHSARPGAAGLRAILALTSYHIATRTSSVVTAK
ncbi:MAG: hypothetical protein JWL96_3396 [Sphingomonas bacterium]|uniref:hypothetical protein n=1 Tax=Sphingomonas bacterium TaxID=1895847 RepID=UPI0026326DCC|nr:hypothetical protein [Sphingomonas bacterium]MDB5711326.1 hypothetical protein [Sphingomonas bacterium]